MAGEEDLRRLLCEFDTDLSATEQRVALLLEVVRGLVVLGLDPHDMVAVTGQWFVDHGRPDRVAMIAATLLDMLARQHVPEPGEVRALGVHEAMWPQLVAWLESQGHVVFELPDAAEPLWLHAPRPYR